MANVEHLTKLKEGVEAWNKWREANHRERIELSGAYLISANLSGAVLSGAVLSRADLSGANLRVADLRVADLSGAILKGSVLYETVFGNALLKECKGLPECKFEGPCTIDLRSIQQSWPLPIEFLRGVGLSQTFIDYIPSLIGEPFEFYKCFISHSSKDKRFCDRVYADLQAKGVRCWYFPEDATWGKSVWGEIDRSIKLYDKLVVICSKKSLNSRPVVREIERALQREDSEGGNILFPVRIDNYLFDEWEHERKADVVAKVVGDFRGWSGSAEKYQAAFERLLAGLKAEKEASQGGR